MAYNAPHWPLQAPQEYIDRCKGRYDAGYDAIRNARYQRQIELGVVDPESTKLSEPEYDRPWEDSPRNSAIAASSKWKSMPPWSKTWTTTLAACSIC